MVKNYTAVQNDVNLNVSSEEFNRKESNDGMENTTESVHSIFCCGGRGTRISELFPDIPKPMIRK